MIPYRHALGILLQIYAEPIASSKHFSSLTLLALSAEEIVVPESPLCDSDRVVLHADAAAVVEHGDAVGVKRSGIIGFFSEWHVVFARS